MQEIVKETGKLVIIEVADVFLAKPVRKSSFEEIPDETLQPKDYQDWLKVEDRATRSVFMKVAAKAKKEGYDPKAVVLTVDQVRAYLKRKGYSEEETALPLGLNGMYMLKFKKN
jgi:hypothetical protein